MGKWFDQAAEIERLRNENRRLKARVRSLELRLGVSYGQREPVSTASRAPMVMLASTLRVPTGPATASSGQGLQITRPPPGWN